MEKIKDMLAILELKVNFFKEEKRVLVAERDAMAQKIIELQDEVDRLSKRLNELTLCNSQKDEDLIMTSLIVEELLENLEDSNPLAEKNGVV
jgi:hypothetical protein